MSEAINSKFDLDQFSEAETDEDFSMPEFREHFADTLTPVVLKEWTARDFASVYVRFRPHLERHAKRFTKDHAQAEEVVQDAFLYLMTALPELDSELGVLKYLKWKVRLLALDLLRAGNSWREVPLGEDFLMENHTYSLDSRIERADDAAVVALALSKLNPRHREAIIATVYEDKSYEVTASQMGLSTNAFRQLLHRARASFKKILIGEADTEGKTISEILSMASSRALDVASRASALLLIAGFGLLAGFHFSPSAPTASENVSQPLLLDSSIADAEDTSADVGDSGFSPGLSPPNVSEAGNEDSLLASSISLVEGEPEVGARPPTHGVKVVESSEFLAKQRLDSDKSRFGVAIEGAVEESLPFTVSETTPVDEPASDETLLHVGLLGSEAEIYLGLNFSGQGSVNYLNIRQQHVGSGLDLALVPTNLFMQKSSEPSDAQIFEIWASGFLAADLSGRFSNVVAEETTVSDYVLFGQVSFDPASGELVSEFQMLSRTDFVERQTKKFDAAA